MATCAPRLSLFAIIRLLVRGNLYITLVRSRVNLRSLIRPRSDSGWVKVLPAGTYKIIVRHTVVHETKLKRKKN